MEKLECMRIDRIHENKDRRYKHGNVKIDDECLFLSIADGDFAFSKEIANKVNSVINKRNLAYVFQEEDNSKTIVKYFKKHYGVDISEEEVLYGNGVIYWVQIAIQSLTNKKDGVLIMPPVYDPFAEVIKNAGRNVIESPLIFNGKEFKINFENLEKQMKKSKLLIFCSPHNPTGNVWSKDDIISVLDLAKKHGTYVISDEIWQDIVFDTKEYSSVLEFEKYKDIVIHTSGPAKTFNLGGIQFGIAIVKGKKLLEKIQMTSECAIHYSSSQPWVSAAVQAAYGDDKTFEWVDSYMKQISKNYKILTSIFKENDIQYSEARGTYLVFANLGKNKMKGKELEELMIKEGLFTGMGYKYGDEYSSWVRINIAICDNSMKLLSKKLAKIISSI